MRIEQTLLFRIVHLKYLSTLSRLFSSLSFGQLGVRPLPFRSNRGTWSFHEFVHDTKAENNLRSWFYSCFHSYFRSWCCSAMEGDESDSVADPLLINLLWCLRCPSTIYRWPSMQNSDYLGMTLITPVLIGNNYLSWSRSMKIALWC